jgi:xylulokinase
MPSQRLILAHDLGTTGNKATLFDADGSLLSSAFAPYPTNYPQPNWAEQNPQEWWNALCQTTQKLLKQSAAHPRAVAAVSFSGQMMGCLPIDRTGQPLRSCIIWADQRAQAEADEMAQRCDPTLVYQTTGHRISAAYTAAKILWLRRHQPELYQQAACFLMPKDYLAYRLTGVLATDYSDASGALLFDLQQHAWSPHLLHALALASEQLPTPHRSLDVIGVVTSAAAAECGLAAGTPVVIGGGDGACASVGAGVVDAGAAYCYIGSSSWISVSTAQPLLDPQQRTFTFCHLHPERYAPMGTMQAAGGARDWAWGVLRGEGGAGVEDRGTGGQGDKEMGGLDGAAAATPVGARGLIFLPYLLGERSPHWNPLARGAFVGLAMPHRPDDMARAVLEGVALNLRLILDALRSQVAGIEAMRLIGGGSRSSLWPQILADAFRLPIHLLELKGEATSWGAAVAGGVGVGLFDWSMAAQRSQVVDMVEPIPSHAALYDELLGIFADSYQALAPVFARLARLES